MEEKKQEKTNTTKSYLKALMQKAKKAVDLMVGNAEDYAREDAGGDLRFDPRIMMKINVTFDKNFLPQEKIVKLNLRGARFFNEIKVDLREINSIFIVYPHTYAFQLDTRKDEWEKKLVRELNSDYSLELQMIRFFNEEDISRMHQRAGIESVRNPYKLKEGELLIIAGGFTNFHFAGIPLCQINAEISTSNGKKILKKIHSENYYTKFSEKAGAYFYVGSEWYHNLFIPELFDNEHPFFFSVRVGDDGKNLKFFSDSKRIGVDIRGEVKTEFTPENEKIIHAINPEYLAGSKTKELTLSAVYDIAEVEDESPVVEIYSKGKFKAGHTDDIDNENLPFLEDAMILLPSPNEDDIPSYIMKIGDEKRGIKFFASSMDKEISIVAPGKEKKIYKRDIDDSIDYSIKFGSFGYSISNEFINRFGDKELKVYFSWALSSNMVNRIPLPDDFYILGREPFMHMDEALREKIKTHMIQLNEGIQDFWRIGASRNHAVLVKEISGKCRIYNISSSFPVYVVREEDLEKPVISPFKLEPTTGNKERKKLDIIFADIEKGKTEKTTLSEKLNECADGLDLEKNDLIFIGNRVYKFIVPLVMESRLSSKAQLSVLRKIQESSNISALERD